MNPLLAGLPEAERSRLRPAPASAWVAPMLATLSEEVPEGPGWLFEPKLDGVRCIVRLVGGRAALHSRNKNDITRSFPEIARALAALGGPDMVLDGELVVMREGRTSFEALQERIHLQAPGAELCRRVPVLLYLFDLLNLDGADLTALPLFARKALLRRALRFRSPLRYTPHRLRGGRAHLEDACRRGEEGIMAKRADARYVSRRSRDWLKLKCVRSEEFVIGGFTLPKGSRAKLGALLIGQYAGGRLRYAGKVGTGLDTAMLHHLYERLEALELPAAPFAPPVPAEPGVRWVAPRLVAQVAFGERTATGMLRHPRFLGLRPDKPPRSVGPERPLRRRAGRPRRAAR